MKSAVLLVASFWHAKYHAKKVNKLIEKTFTQEDMFSDMVKLCNMLSREKPQKHRTTDRRSGGEAQAQALYQLLEDLDSNGITPEFVVGVDQMEEVQRATSNSSLADGDNVQIGARLESLEKEIKDLGVKIGLANNSHPGPSLGEEKAPNIVVTEMPKQSFANIVAARPATQKNNVTKPRSNSQKRGIDDDNEGFNMVKKKKCKAKLEKVFLKLLL